MKSLKSIVEASILADVDDQLEAGDEALESMIIKWIKANISPIQDNKLNFDINATSIIVNYDSDVEFKTNAKSLTNGMFQWGRIKGNFNCAYCKSLKSLEGAPQEIEGNFWCNNCKSLKSLEGAPQEIEGSFYCSNCISLKSLVGAPKKVERNFDCSHCDALKSLEGAPVYVGGGFYCDSCVSLKSLEYAPKYVGRDFNCRYCISLKSLEYAPKEVGGDFWCNSCRNRFNIVDVNKLSNIKGKIVC